MTGKYRYLVHSRNITDQSKSNAQYWTVECSKIRYEHSRNHLQYTSVYFRFVSMKSTLIPDAHRQTRRDKTVFAASGRAVWIKCRIWATNSVIVSRIAASWRLQIRFHSYVIVSSCSRPFVTKVIAFVFASVRLIRLHAILEASLAAITSSTRQTQCRFIDDRINHCHGYDSISADTPRHGGLSVSRSLAVASQGAAAPNTTVAFLSYFNNVWEHVCV